MSKPLMEFALDYARRGWHVFPCKPSNKAPYIAGGLNSATTDPDVIRDWWDQWPHAMIGVRTGQASGVWALDPDMPDKPGAADGLANWRGLVARNSGCPPTHSHLTPRGGLHLLFKWRDDRPITNSEGQLQGTGINVRGEGGYIIAPPSCRHDGKMYEVAESLDIFNFAEAPDWLYEMITAKPPTISERAVAAIRQPKVVSSRPYAEAALLGEYQDVASTTSGNRNARLNIAALKLGTLVAADELTEAEVVDTLYAAATANGSVADDGHRAAMATINSGMRKGLQEPRRIPEREATSVVSLIPSQAAPPARLIVSSADFIAGFVPPDYLIDGLIQRRFVYSITAPTGSGKTAVALLLAAYVALGRSVGEYPVERGRVLYLAGENPDDVRMRWLAMSEAMDFDVETIDVHFLPGVFKLSEIAGRIVAETEKIGPVSFVIVDTSAAYFEGADENANVEMGNHARRMRSLVNLPGEPCVLVACHPVKNPDLSSILPRGGGAFLAEVDGNLTLSKTDTIVSLHWQGKFRGPDFAPISFLLASATADRLKDSKGRNIPTVIAKTMSEQERSEAEANTRSDEDDLLIAISANERSSQAGLATALGWVSDSGPNKAKVNRCAKRLKHSKYLKNERGTLLLTDKGKAEVKRLKTNRDLAGSRYG